MCTNHETPAETHLQKVYTDYLASLLKHVKQDIRRRLGYDAWQEQRGLAEVVFTHPSSWGVQQLEALRDAATATGLIPRERNIASLHFVSEADAYASFALRYCDRFRAEVQVVIDSMFDIDVVNSDTTMCSTLSVLYRPELHS